MANIVKYLGRIKPVFRRSSNRLKIIVTVAIILAILGLFTLRGKMAALQDRNEALESQAAALEQENSDLRDKLSIQGSREAVIRIARELLGLVMPDTVIVQPEG